MTAAETIWNQNAGRSDISLVRQFNHNGKLRSQFPIAPLRVVYAASGTIPAALLLNSSAAVIEQKLLEPPSHPRRKATSSLSILNSETARERTQSLQARGQWGARHFDKVIFTLPIPRFDETASLHMDLADAGREAERLAASVVLPEGIKFQQARKRVRDALTEAGISPRIDDLVARLLDET